MIPFIWNTIPRPLFKKYQRCLFPAGFNVNLLCLWFCEMMSKPKQEKSLWSSIRAILNYKVIVLTGWANCVHSLGQTMKAEFLFIIFRHFSWNWASGMRTQFRTKPEPCCRLNNMPRAILGFFSWRDGSWFINFALINLAAHFAGRINLKLSLGSHLYWKRFSLLEYSYYGVIQIIVFFYWNNMVK